MTENLTTWNDEQLRGLADYADSLLVRGLAGGLLALRAERAKPTQSDEERVNELCNDHNEDGSQSPHLAKDILALIASIRAEGSAEPAKLEAALRKEHHLASVRFDEPMLTRLDLALDSLAQPAESGATEKCGCKAAGCPSCWNDAISGAKP